MLVGIDLGVFRLGGETDNHTAHVPGHKKIDRQRKLQLDTIYFFGWCQESFGAGSNYWSRVFCLRGETVSHTMHAPGLTENQ